MCDFSCNADLLKKLVYIIFSFQIEDSETRSTATHAAAFQTIGIYRVNILIQWLSVNLVSGIIR